MTDTYKTFAYGAEVSAGAGGVSTLATDLAVLVADGASPTQGHVNTVANDISALLGGTSSQTAGGVKKAAILVVVDTTVVPTVSVLREMFNRILRDAAGSMLP